MATTFIFVLLAPLLRIASTNSAATGSLLGALAPGIDTKAADTVRALDNNGNGKVDKAEITVFAKSQGLSSGEVLSDFQELDANNDGELDSSEIGGLLGDPAPDAQAKPASPTVAKPASPTVAKTAAEAAPTPRAPKNNDVKAADTETLPMEAAEIARLDAPKIESQPQQSRNPMDLDLAALEHDTQQQAGNIIASRLAQRAQVLLARSSADEGKAKNFDADVRALRGNATALAQGVNDETRKAASKTVAEAARKSLAQLEKLQKQEHDSETAADEHREQAREAMLRVRKAQASLHNTPASTKGSAMIQLTVEATPGSQVAEKAKTQMSQAQLDKLTCQDEDAEAGRCQMGDDGPLAR